MNFNRYSGTAEEVQEKKALQTGSLIGQLADADYLQIDDFYADSVVATGVAVGGILIAGDQLLQLTQMAIRSVVNLGYHGQLQNFDYDRRNGQRRPIRGLITSTTPAPLPLATSDKPVSETPPRR